MDQEQARTVALALPETTEAPHHDMTSFRVAGKIFATMPPDDEHLHVFVDEAETLAAVSEDSGAFEELWWGKRLSGVRVALSSAPPERVGELIEEAWRRRAPKGLVADFDQKQP